MLFVVATLTVRAGQLARFEEYEHKSLAVAARHGGRLERSVRALTTKDGEHIEVHVLRFPNAEAFGDFRSDPDIVTLADLRDAVISHTDVVVGAEGPAYVL